jgi:branched-chain amino acid transport system ATP-binding protein
MQDFLRVDSIEKSFAGVKVIDQLSFNVEEGDIIGIVGPNGAGKTTLINLICGMLPLDEGTIHFKGERIDRLKPHEIVRKGIARTFQIPKPFKKMTVTENLIVPMLTKHNKPDYGRIQELLTTLNLQRVAQSEAQHISGGQQKLLEIGRILALDPDLLLLDEPTAGVHPDLRRTIVQILQGIGNKTILIVTHDLNFVTSLCRHVIVMNAGTKLVEGDLRCLQDPRVVEAYLGR